MNKQNKSFKFADCVSDIIGDIADEFVCKVISKCCEIQHKFSKVDKVVPVNYKGEYCPKEKTGLAWCFNPKKKEDFLNP